jgi:beta-mannosidase
MSSGLKWDDLDIDLWWPNGHGSQKLYQIRVELLDQASRTTDTCQKRVGFKQVRWEKCLGAPDAADPWLCIVNSKPVFLQGINWTPIRPNFADVKVSEYAARLRIYRDMGVNTMRVWGGAFLEKEAFYDLCDESGFLVWQELPMSSSMIDNAPPDDAGSIAEMADISRSYIERRAHHVCLFVWCGGNELQTALDGTSGIGTPLGTSHPMLGHLAIVIAELDPSRRFLPTSASGPRFMADEAAFGKGEHWDVHGPWKPQTDLERDWARYWQNDDALMRSEVGSPAPSSADLIRRYKGDCDELPASNDNPLWRKVQWWPEWDAFINEKGRPPKDLEEYVEWGQDRRARALQEACPMDCDRRI